MSRNGSGTYSLPAGNPVVTGTTISSTWANTTLADISNALTGSLASDGQTTATGNLNMGTNKVVNAGDPTNPQDLATKYYTDTEIAAAKASITPADVSDQVNTSTGYFQIPKGTVSERPSSPVEGLIRYNSDSDFYEGYINGDWVKFQTSSQSNYTGTYVLVAGGGGGASSTSGIIAGSGGGAGGLLTNTFTLAPSTNYTFLIGGGGAANTSGSNSGAFSLTAIGGGGGNGTSGGSGAGGGQPNGTAGSGTTGQGYAGGSGASFAAGGGGGAGGSGVAGTGNQGGNGGTGVLYSTLSTYYAGGGGGGGYYTSTGGTGGGGGGGDGFSVGPSAGSANTGGGGGGGGNRSSTEAGGAGGSGIFILTVPTVNYTGTTTGSPTVSASGGFTTMQFTSSGSYTA